MAIGERSIRGCPGATEGWARDRAMPFGPGLLVMSLLMCCLGASEAWCAERTTREASPEQALFQAVLKKHDAHAAVALARRGKKGTGFLKRGLEHGRRPGALCAWALWRHPQLSLEPQLRGLLRKTDQVAGYWAARALGKLGQRQSVPALAAMLPGKPNAFWELSRGGKGWLRHKNARNVRTPEFAPPDMPNLRVAYAAMEALGQIGGTEAHACLRKALRDEQYLIRYGAARGLATMRSGEALGELDRLAVADPVLVVRNTARDAAIRIRGASPAAPADPPPMPPALIFIKAKNRSESNLGFRDSYWFPRVPWYHWARTSTCSDRSGPMGP